MLDQMIVFATLVIALVLFAHGRLRYDLVALLALMAVSLTGVIDSGQAFSGFGQPQVITVGAILVITRGLSNGGAADVFSRLLGKIGRNAYIQILSLTTLAGALSAFMNNVGALALLLPVTIRMAKNNNMPPSALLMPLSFATLLGGMTTLIGTPPNLIIAGFREEVKGAPFNMFDYTAVGALVAIVGILFISLVGWKLMPKRKGGTSSADSFTIEEGYLTELRVREDSDIVGQTIRDLNVSIDADYNILALVHDNYPRFNPASDTVISPHDVLLIQADSNDIARLLESGKMELVGSKELSAGSLQSGDNIIAEAVVKNTSPMLNRTVQSLNLRSRYGINLLAVARQGGRVQKRLKEVTFRPGDILLVQGKENMVSEALQSLGCLPLADRDVHMRADKQPLIPLALFAIAIAATTLGYLPAQLSFPAAAIAMIVTNQLTLREAYNAIDFPILILLGAMIPVGQALEVSGGAQTIANLLLGLTGNTVPILTLGLLMIVTMTLSNILNNAAAAVLLAPIGLNLASTLGASPDAFLIAVALSASCAFMTPIGHQSNTLVMGPGGYRFTDYWRMGLPLQIIILVVSIPLISVFWPL